MKRLFYVLLVALLITTISSCHKDKTPPYSEPPAGSLVVWNNVHIVDTSQWILFQTGNGSYYYTFTPTTPNVNVKTGDIIVGYTNGGYIRKVTSTSLVGQYFVIATNQATLADVFKSGTFTLQVPINDSSQSQPGVYRSLSNYQLYNQYGYSVKLLDASFDIQPNFAITFTFDSVAGLTNFQMSTTNSTLRDSATIAFNGLEPYSWSGGATVITYTVNTLQWVQAYGNISVPVPIQLNLSYSISANGGSANYGVDTSNTIVNWVSSAALTGGAQYNGSMWQPLHSSLANNSVAEDSAGSNGNMNSRITFSSQITSLFYGIGGPQVTYGLSGDIEGSMRFTPGYTRRTDAWSLETLAQTVVPIFGRNMNTFTQTYYFDSVFFQTPYQLIMVSGNNQTGDVVTQLPNPLVVKVIDSNGNPVQGVTVDFTVSNGGSLSGSTITDQNGVVQVYWVLGPPNTTQTVTATVVDGGHTPINGAPLTFTATAQ